MNEYLSASWTAAQFLVVSWVVYVVHDASREVAATGARLHPLKFCLGGLALCAVLAVMLGMSVGEHLDEDGHVEEYDEKVTDADRWAHSLGVFLVLSIPMLLGARRGYEQRGEEDS